MVDVTNLQGQQGGQTQGQQTFADDILGGEDIFAPIPDLEVEEDDLPYGDLLEKKYQFEPIPEEIEVTDPVVEPVQAPVQVQAHVEMPVEKIISPVIEQQPEINEVQTINEPVVAQAVLEPVVAQREETPVAIAWEDLLKTDVQKKFGELFFTTKKVYELKEKLNISEESFDILGANNDKIFISYKCVLDEKDNPTIYFTKTEENKETEEEIVNELTFVFDRNISSLHVMINETLLFDELQDFSEDQKKKLQVVDKINKFMFLASEEVRKLEKIIKEKEEEERERRRLHEIFRNF